VLKMLMRFAVLERMRRDNPAAEVERYEIRSEGYPTWSEEQLARYLDHHPPGSDARLSALIMVWTGAAIGDVWAMGWHNIVSDRLVYRRAKTGNEVTLPLSGMPELVAALPRDRLLFIHSPRGIPYASPDSLGHAFKRWCKRARVPEVSAHGLRKLFATRHANAGANELEIRALLGDHKTDEALKYTRAASRARAADRSFDRLKGEQKTANTPEMLATRGRQPNGKKG